MLPYLIILFPFCAGALFFSGMEGRTKSDLRLVFFAIILTLFIGLRDHVGIDWRAYSHIWLVEKSLTLPEAIVHREPAFYTLVALLWQYYPKLWALNLICAAIFVYGLYAFALRQPNPWLAFVIAVAYVGFVIGMSAVRQSAAIGLILIALAAFQDRKLVKAIAFVIMAAMFHASAIIMAPLIAISYTRNRFQALLLIAVAAYPCYLAVSGQFEIYASRYSIERIQSSGALVRIAMNVVPALIYIVNQRRITPLEEDRTLWRNISLMSIGCLLVYAVFESSTAADRLSLYASPLQIYTFTRVPLLVAHHEARSRAIGTYLVVLLYVAVLVVYMSFGRYRAGYIPYHFGFPAA